MRILLAIILLLSGSAAAFAWDTYIGRNMTVRITGLSPGNILQVRDDDGRKFPVRFYGIGIPGPCQPLGADARAMIASLLPDGAKAILTTVNQDEEGIVNALVQIQDRSVNNRLVSDGLAWVDRSTCKAFFCRRWHIEEHLAQKERRGIWSLNISTPPWQWGNTD